MQKNVRTDFVVAATLTSKGQLTMPAELRERLGLKAGDKVEFYVDASGETRLRPLNRPASAIFGSAAEYRREVTEAERRKLMATAMARRGTPSRAKLR